LIDKNELHLNIFLAFHASKVAWRAANRPCILHYNFFVVIISRVCGLYTIVNERVRLSDKLSRIKFNRCLTFKLHNNELITVQTSARISYRVLRVVYTSICIHGICTKTKSNWIKTKTVTQRFLNECVQTNLVTLHFYSNLC